MGDRSIEIDHRRGHHGAQPVVERSNSVPVGIGRAARARMAGRKCGLQRIGAVAPESFGAGQRVKASADQQLVPACAVLLGQRYEGAVRADARRQARCLDFHQGQQAEHLGILGHQPRQHAAQPLRLQAQARPDKVVARRGRVAFVEDQVDDFQHRGEPHRAPGAARHLEAGSGLPDRLLRADDALGNCRLARQEGTGDLVRRQAADNAQRERRAGVGRKHWVAGCEDEAQQLVAEIVVHGRFDRLGRAIERAVQLPRDLLVLAFAHLVATDCVDGAPFGGCHQPGAGIGRYAGPGPFGKGDYQGVLRQFLCTVDIAHQPSQARDEPGPFDAKSRFNRPVRFPCGHAALSARAIRQARWPRPTGSGSETAESASRAKCAAELLAHATTDFLGLRRKALLEVSNLEQRPDLDLAWSRHGIGTALHPGDCLVHVLDLPEPETGDQLAGLGERPVDDGAAGAIERDALAL